MSTNQSSELPKGSRRAIRRVVDFGCELVTPQHDEPLLYNASDLSPFGMWIQTPEPMRTGEELVVCFQPPGWSGGELLVFAEVARVATARRRLDQPGVGMGLEFTDLGKSDHHLLARWLADRKTPVPRRRRPVPRRGWRVPPPPFRAAPEPIAFRPVGSAWR